jgi:glycosyltransferase involved in cell wall biosynthesis
MSVWNGEQFLKAAIDSILVQTYQDFEFLIIDDCSIDSTRRILESYADERIRIIRNDVNLGLTKSLNRGLDVSRGRYIARMDADDLSLPNRLMEQVRFMDANPSVAVCGTGVIPFGPNSEGAPWDAPADDATIRAMLFFGSLIYHPTAMLRAECLSMYDLRYDEGFGRSQDYELWCRIAKIPGARFALLEHPLLKYRQHEASVSATARFHQNRLADLCRHRLLSHLNLTSIDSLRFHKMLVNGESVHGILDTLSLVLFASRLATRGQRRGFVALPSIVDRKLRNCLRQSGLKGKVLKASMGAFHFFSRLPLGSL